MEQVIPGRFQPTDHGQIFVAEKWYSPDYRHGRTGLQLNTSLHTIARWANELRLLGAEPAQLAFLDTETTGLAGGTGTYAFLIGVGRFEGEQFRLVQFFMADPAEEPAQLAALTDFLAPCQVLVTFNGKAFDAPLVNSRYITNGQPSPLPKLAHLDLLPLARRLWRDRLASRALGQLELHILQANRTEEDIPGWLIPTFYFDYLRSGDARPLKGIFYHNAMDVLAMAALLNHITHLLVDPLDGRVEHGIDLVALAKFFESLGQLDRAVHLYRHGLAQELPEDYYWEHLERLALLLKRQEDWPAALELWQQAAAARQIYAHVELAKYYEHRAGDCRQAAQWTETALAIVQAPTYPSAGRHRWRSELLHRLTRLQRKLE